MSLLRRSLGRCWSAVEWSAVDRDWRAQPPGFSPGEDASGNRSASPSITYSLSLWKWRAACSVNSREGFPRRHLRNKWYSMSDRLLAALATANPDKVAEIKEILQDTGLYLQDRPAGLGEIDETGETIEENAMLKARAVGEYSGLPAVADDTGLEVAALDGRPGVYSSRYAGPGASYTDNVNALLKELARVGVLDAASRGARFVTAACLWIPGDEIILARGIVEGYISPNAAGDGWGYDPVFVPLEGDGRTFAEMGAGEKNAISHRGRAFRELASMIKDRYSS